MIKYIFSIVLLLLNFDLVFSQTGSKNAGTASVLFLRSDLSARTASLSGAFTAYADDENALQYNPAGLANISSSALGLNHSEWFQNIRMDHLIFTYKFDDKLGWAVSMSHMWMPTIQGKDIYGQPTRKLNVSTSVVQLGIGYKITPSFFLGLGVKYFNDRLADYGADGLAMDLGFFLYTMVPGFRVGAAVQNLGPKVQYDVKREQLPLTFRAGISYKAYFVSGLVIAIDAIKSLDSDVYPVAGIEYRFAHLLSFRIGNSFRDQSQFLPTMGVGLAIAQKYFINYAFSMNPDLGNTHKIGFTFRFHKPGKRYGTNNFYAIPKPVLLPPHNVRYEITQSGLLIRWERVPGARYYVYARSKGQQKWTRINAHPLFSNQMSFKKIHKNRVIYITVTSVINEKESAHSKEVRIETK